jgi:hypothetical protein
MAGRVSAPQFWPLSALRHLACEFGNRRRLRGGGFSQRCDPTMHGEAESVRFHEIATNFTR